MPSPLQIRPYAAADEPAVIVLWTECGLIVPHNDPHKDIRRKLQVNPGWFLIGEQDGRIIATCMVGYEGPRGLDQLPGCRALRAKKGHRDPNDGRSRNLVEKGGLSKNQSSGQND